MWISEFKNYKAFLKAVLKTFPKAGRGQSRRLAEHLNVAPIVVSQILSRDRHFTADQALKVCEFFGFDEATSEYFLYQVSIERADTKTLKEFYRKKMQKLRDEAQRIKSHVQGKDVLSDFDKAVFYSNWFYSGVRILISIPGYQNIEAISQYFGLDRNKVGEIVSFLISTGLIVEEKGKLRLGQRSTHIPDDSPLVNNHRRNWRQKAIEKFSSPSEADLFYVSLVSISEKDVETVRKEIMELIKKFSARVAPSAEEKLMCLNIDWFEA